MSNLILTNPGLCFDLAGGSQKLPPVGLLPNIEIIGNDLHIFGRSTQEEPYRSIDSSQPIYKALRKMSNEALFVLDRKHVEVKNEICRRRVTIAACLSFDKWRRDNNREITLEVLQRFPALTPVQLLELVVTD